MAKFTYCIIILSFVFLLQTVTANKDTTSADLLAQVQALKIKVKHLSLKLKDVESTKQDLVDRLKTALNNIEHIKEQSKSEKKRAYTDSQVAFYAGLRHSRLGLAVHETVVFDDDYTSTSPDLYDSATGIFTAPVTGFYVFSWTQNVNHGDYQSTELVVDGKSLAWAYADTAADAQNRDYGSSSQTVVVKVKEGQHAFIRTGPQGNGNLHGEDYSTFSGFLLYKTETSGSSVVG